MKSVKVKCQVCGKSYPVTSIYKDYVKVVKNPNYPYHCERCATNIQAEAFSRYLKSFRREPDI